MCQTSVMMEKGDRVELLLDNVTSLAVDGNDICITTLFEGQKSYADVAIRRIDFNEGKVFLCKTESTGS